MELKDHTVLLCTWYSMSTSTALSFVEKKTPFMGCQVRKGGSCFEIYVDYGNATCITWYLVRVQYGIYGVVRYKINKTREFKLDLH